MRDTIIPISYIGIGRNPVMVRALFNCEEREQQGVVEIMPYSPSVLIKPTIPPIIS